MCIATYRCVQPSPAVHCDKQLTFQPIQTHHSSLHRWDLNQTWLTTTWTVTHRVWTDKTIYSAYRAWGHASYYMLLFCSAFSMLVYYSSHHCVIYRLRRVGERKNCQYCRCGCVHDWLSRFLSRKWTQCKISARLIWSEHPCHAGGFGNI